MRDLQSSDHLLLSAGHDRLLLPRDRRLAVDAMTRLWPAYSRSGRLALRMLGAAFIVGLPLGRSIPARWVNARVLTAAEELGTHSTGWAALVADNQKLVVVMYGSDLRPFGFAKLARGGPGAAQVRNEWEAIRSLPPALHMGRHAPAILHYETNSGLTLLVTAPMPGVPASLDITRGDLEILSKLTGPARRVQTSDLFQQLLRLPRELRFHSLWRRIESLAAREVPATFVHGDFAPWNIRRVGDHSAALDWEKAVGDGLPMFDITTHRLRSLRVARRSIPSMLARLRKDAEDNIYGLDPRTADDLVIACLMWERHRRSRYMPSNSLLRLTSDLLHEYVASS